MKYFGWRRAEFAHWLKWVPESEQLECFPGVDMGDPSCYLDNEVSVSALGDGDESYG